MRCPLLAPVILAAAWAGCGSGQPADATIYHDPGLRPGLVEPADDAERELLVRLASLDGEAAIELGGRTFAAEAPYTAASGRRCRRVREPQAEHLACETDGEWVFVPDLGASP